MTSLAGPGLFPWLSALLPPLVDIVRNSDILTPQLILLIMFVCKIAKKNKIISNK